MKLFGGNPDGTSEKKPREKLFPRLMDGLVGLLLQALKSKWNRDLWDQTK